MTFCIFSQFLMSNGFYIEKVVGNSDYMSYPINSQRINPNLNPAMGINTSLSGVDPNSIKSSVNDTVNDSPITKAVVSEHKGLVAILMAPIFAGLVFAMDKFNKACATQADGTNLLTKVRDFGDKIGNHKIFQSKSIGRVQGFVNTVRKFVNEKLIDKSRILTAMFRTPSKPVNNMVVTQALGTGAEVAKSAAEALKEYAQLEKQGKAPVTYNLDKLKAMGFEKNGEADIEAFEKVINDSHLNINKIIDICEKLAKNGIEIKNERAVKIPLTKYIFREQKYLTDFIPWTKRYLGKKINFSEFSNKLSALECKEGVTALGRFLPKALLRNIEALTFGMNGGKVGMIMQAGMIAAAIKKTIEAPKGEKTKTFAENMLYNQGFYLTIPISTKVMHYFGGLQYIGMGKDNVEKFREEELKTFNEKAAARLLTKEQHKAGKRVLLDALKGDTRILKTDSFGVKSAKFAKNLVYRPLKRAARIFMVGLETIHPYIPKNAGQVETFLRKVFFNCKRGAGYPVRFLAFGFITAPFFAKLFAKASHIVFGKPTHSVLDEGKEEKEKEKQQQAAQQHPTMPVRTARVQTPVTEQQMQTSQPQMAMPSQLIPNSKDNYLPPRAIINSQGQQPSIVVDNNMVNTVPVAPKENVAPKTPEPLRTYIPSSEPVKISPKQYETDTKAQNALSKANGAEQAALKFVH